MRACRRRIHCVVFRVCVCVKEGESSLAWRLLLEPIDFVALVFSLGIEFSKTLPWTPTTTMLLVRVVMVVVTEEAIPRHWP